jgi:hypothetical protein
MNDAPETEAREFLRETLWLRDVPLWRSEKELPWYREMECGLLQSDGATARMFVQFQISYSPNTRKYTQQFTVFKPEFRGATRVYQLTVTRFERRIKDAHALSHEHWGGERSVAHPEWSSWTFEQALSYFCAQTHIVIEPPIGDPQELHLK